MTRSIGSKTSSSWSDAMAIETMLREQWLQIRDRLQAKQLLAAPAGSLSLRIPGAESMWFGSVADAEPRQMRLHGVAASLGGAGLHAAIYVERDDVGAVATGSGTYASCLADFGAAMPGVFDEQVRHLGCMGPAVDVAGRLSRSLANGCNALLVGGQPVCLGMTGARVALNTELFEKCAKAYVLAVATGGRVKALPWIVRTVANRRLMKDERRAKTRFRHGQLPEESKGY